jgi:hypothetical protein
MAHSKLKPLIAEAEVALYQLTEAMSEKVEETVHAHIADLTQAALFGVARGLGHDLQELLDLHDEIAERLDEANEAVKGVFEIGDRLEKLNSLVG